jgi:hypothetical protein
MRAIVLFRLVWKDLVHDRLRSVLSLALLSVLVTLFLLVTALARALQTFGSDEGTPANNLWIISANVIDPGHSSLYQETLDQAAADVRANYGPDSVTAASPVIFRYLRVADRLMQILAVPPADAESVHHLELLDGHWPRTTSQAAVSRSAMSLLDASIGEQVEVYGRPFSIVALFEPPSAQAVSIGMTYAAGQNLLGTGHGFQIGVLQLSPQSDVPAVQSWLEQTPNLAGRYSVYQARQVTRNLTRILEATAVLGRVFQMLALLVVTFGSLNAASLFVLERQRDINTLYAIGYSTSTVQTVLLIRTCILSLAAFLPGWAVASLLLAPHQGGAVVFSSAIVPVVSGATTASAAALVVMAAGAGAWFAGRQPQAPS